MAVITLPTLYFGEIINADRQFQLREIVTDANAPKITWRHRYNFFDERNGIHMFNRFIYVVFRGVYVCLIFYFGPNLYLIIKQFKSVNSTVPAAPAWDEWLAD